jgi:SAM-dependent methyltransferase
MEDLPSEEENLLARESSVERRAWLRELRRAAEEGYDEFGGTTYVEGPEEITLTHHQFVARLTELCPPRARILDAACGTGRYFGMILTAGHRVTGADQSAGMLARARARHPEVDTKKVGLQELDFDARFDAVLCVDAMEFVFPEDWPLVLANLGRALRSKGHLYLTVEQVDVRELEKAFGTASAQGLPVVPGENILRGGYHFYPTSEQVTDWLRDAGLTTTQEAHSDHGSYGYYHLLTQKAN